MWAGWCRGPGGGGGEGGGAWDGKGGEVLDLSTLDTHFQGPRHRENRENGEMNSLSGKTQGIWKFCQNTGKHRVKDIAIVAAKISIFSISWIGLPSQFCVCNTHKLCKLAQGKLVVGQGKHREFEWVPSHFGTVIPTTFL